MTSEITTGYVAIHDEKLSDATRAAISAARELLQEEIDLHRRKLDKAHAVLEAARITFDEREDAFTHARAADVLEVAMELVAGANESLDSASLMGLWLKAGL